MAGSTAETTTGVTAGGIIALNMERTRLARLVELLGLRNVSMDPTARLRFDAEYRLARDAWLKAESDYSKALNNAPPDMLRQIVDGAGPASTT